jgi:hypothetical protein
MAAASEGSEIPHSTLQRHRIAASSKRLLAEPNQPLSLQELVQWGQLVYCIQSVVKQEFSGAAERNHQQISERYKACSVGEVC